MESPEVPLEKVQEHIEERAHESEEKWIARVALSTAVLAAFAAVASLLAGDHADEAMLSQIRASDQWSYYQAKSIKAAILGARVALEKSGDTAENEKLKTYENEQEEIKREADALEKESRGHLAKHVPLARAVTMFQIAIAVAAISVLTKRRAFWIVSLIFGAAGLAFILFAHLPRG